MARIKDNYVVHGTSGAVGKQQVYRFRNGKTFVSKHPDMSKVIPSKNQTKSRKIFGEASKFAKAVVKNPEKQKELNLTPGKTLYRRAIKAYMKYYHPKKSFDIVLPKEVRESLQLFSLSDFQLLAAAYINECKKLTNKIYQKMNGVSKATASRHLRELTQLNIIKSNEGKGAGAFYTPGSWWKQ